MAAKTRYEKARDGTRQLEYVKKHKGRSERKKKKGTQKHKKGEKGGKEKAPPKKLKEGEEVKFTHVRDGGQLKEFVLLGREIVGEVVARYADEVIIRYKRAWYVLPREPAPSDFRPGDLQKNHLVPFELGVESLKFLVFPIELYGHYSKSNMVIPSSINQGAENMEWKIDTRGTSPMKIIKLLLGKKHSNRSIRLYELPQLGYILLMYALFWQNKGRGMTEKEVIGAVMGQQEQLARELKKRGGELVVFTPRFEIEGLMKLKQTPEVQDRIKDLQDLWNYTEKYIRAYIIKLIETFCDSGYLLKEKGRYRLHKMYLYRRSQVDGIHSFFFNLGKGDYEFMINNMPSFLEVIKGVRQCKASIDMIPEEFFDDCGSSNLENTKFFAEKTVPFMEKLVSHFYMDPEGGMPKSELQKRKTRDPEMLHSIGALTEEEIGWIGEYYKLGKEELWRVVKHLMESGYLVGEPIEKSREERLVDGMVFDYIHPRVFHGAVMLYGMSTDGIRFRRKHIKEVERGYRDKIKELIGGLHPNSLPVAILPEEFLEQSDYIKEIKDYEGAVPYLIETDTILDIGSKRFGLKKAKLELEILGKAATAKTKTPLMKKIMEGEQSSGPRVVYYFNDEEFENRKEWELSFYEKEASCLLDRGVHTEMIGKDLYEHMSKRVQAVLDPLDEKVYSRKGFIQKVMQRYEGRSSAEKIEEVLGERLKRGEFSVNEGVQLLNTELLAKERMERVKAEGEWKKREAEEERKRLQERVEEIMDQVPKSIRKHMVEETLKSIISQKLEEDRSASLEKVNQALEEYLAEKKKVWLRIPEVSGSGVLAAKEELGKVDGADMKRETAVRGSFRLLWLALSEKDIRKGRSLIDRSIKDEVSIDEKWVREIAEERILPQGFGLSDKQFVDIISKFKDGKLIMIKGKLRKRKFVLTPKFKGDYCKSGIDEILGQKREESKGEGEGEKEKPSIWSFKKR